MGESVVRPIANNFRRNKPPPKDDYGLEFVSKEIPIVEPEKTMFFRRSPQVGFALPRPAQLPRRPEVPRALKTSLKFPIPQAAMGPKLPKVPVVQTQSEIIKYVMADVPKRPRQKHGLKPALRQEEEMVITTNQVKIKILHLMEQIMYHTQDGNLVHVEEMSAKYHLTKQYRMAFIVLKMEEVRNEMHAMWSHLNRTCQRSRKWLEAIGLPNLAQNLQKDKKGWFRVCSDHFDESCYLLRRKLLKTAIPTLKILPSDQSSTNSIVADKQTNTEATKPTKKGIDENKKADDTVMTMIDEHTLRIEINKRAELEETMSTRRAKNLKQFLKYSSKFFGPKTSKLITCQLLMKEIDKQKFRVCHKLFCLELYYHNPMAYRFLQKFIRLPPIARLRNLYLNVSSIFISPRCLQLLKAMVAQMNTKDRCCIVGITSRKLKKHVYYDIKKDMVHGVQQVNNRQCPAKKAFVFMVKGLLSTWQIPVAFALFYDSDVTALQHWSDLIITILIDNGLDIRAFVSDQNDSDCKLLSELRNISSGKNSFIVRGKIIYNIFDVRLLVKSLRDSLMRFDMSIAFEGVATWKHILTFYKADAQLQTNVTVGLTNTPVNPDENQRSSTKHAVQLFSNTIATTMKVFLRLKLLDEDAVATVNLINRVSDLLTVLNLDTFENDSCNKRSFSVVERQELLKELMVYFSGIRLLSKGVLLNYKIGPIMGLIATIKSTLDLWKNLSEDGGNCLRTQSLNIEFIENCFKKIYADSKRRKNKCDEVTTIKFIRGFNKSFMNHFIKNARRNSLKNFESSLSKLHEYLLEKKEENDQVLDLKENTNALLINNIENKIKLPNENVLKYLAGYLMKKALETHSSCAQLKNYLTPSNKKINSFINSHYMEMKIPLEFAVFVVKLELEFNKVFIEGLMPWEVGARALRAMEHLYILPCWCFPLVLIKKVFVRIRIYNAVKDINRQLKTKDIFVVNKIDL